MTNTEVLVNYYEKHKRSLLHKINRRVFDHQDSEDVLMEAFTKAMQYIDSYDKERPFATWFNTILNNCIKDYRRQFLTEKSSAMHNDYESFEEENFPDEDHDLNLDHLQVATIHEEIATKTGDTGEILKMYFLEDKSPSEISPLVGASNKSIRTIIYRFKQEMREKYAQ